MLNTKLQETDTSALQRNQTGQTSVDANLFSLVFIYLDLTPTSAYFYSDNTLLKLLSIPNVDNVFVDK